MAKTYLKRNHGLFIAGRVLTVIEYVTGLLALLTVGIVFTSVSGVWQTIPAISEDVPKELVDYMSLVFISAGVVCLITAIPVAIVGGIGINKIFKADTKEQLLPWAIVVTVCVSSLPGILLILASTLPACRDNVVDATE